MHASPFNDYEEGVYKYQSCVLLMLQLLVVLTDKRSQTLAHQLTKYATTTKKQIKIREAKQLTKISIANPIAQTKPKKL